MPNHRYPLGRDVFCPAFKHTKAVEVCRKQPYAPCQGCAVLASDRDRFGSRLFRIVESTHNPGPLFTPEAIQQQPDNTWKLVHSATAERTKRRKKKKKKVKDVNKARKRKKRRRER